MRRRAVLVGLGAVGAGFGLRRVGVFGPGAARLAAVLEVARSLPGSPLVDTAGKGLAWYDDAVRLADALLDPGIEPGEVRAWLRSRIREDYRAGRLYQLRGWLLAETEVRLLELASTAR